jgi:hypothetical protein
VDDIMSVLEGRRGAFIPSAWHPVNCLQRFANDLSFFVDNFATVYPNHGIRGAQTGTFEQDIRIYNQPYINVCRSGPAETGLRPSKASDESSGEASDESSGEASDEDGGGGRGGGKQLYELYAVVVHQGILSNRHANPKKRPVRPRKWPAVWSISAAKKPAEIAK